jgi:hypothetical protein
MKTLPKGDGRYGFVAREILIITLCLFLLVLFVFVPHYISVQHKAKRVQCAENLKKIGFGVIVWANDNERAKPPFYVSTNEGGTLEYGKTGEIYRHFQAISKEIKEPKYLVCPADAERRPTSDFAAAMHNSNISYFVNLEDETKYCGPNCDGLTTVIAGNRNITGGILTNHSMLINSNSPIQWTSALHNKLGNVVRISGAVETWGTNGWPTYIADRHFFNIAIP